MPDFRASQFVDVIEVAEVLRVSPATVYRMIRDGSLPAIRAGKSFRIPRKVLDQIVLSGLNQWSNERDTVIGQ